MATPVIMPRQGQSVESCVIGAWHKRKGDKIAVGDVLFTYETDKATFEEEAKVEGVLLELFFDEGDEVECLKNVCVIGSEGENVDEFRPVETADGSKSEGLTPSDSNGSGSAFVPCASTTVCGQSSAVSPRAKRLAETSGADIRYAVPSGAGSRIMERDVQAVIEKGHLVTHSERTGGVIPSTTQTRTQTKAGMERSAMTEFDEVKLSNVRKVIAKAMHGSLANSAQLTLHSSFDASDILEFRKKLKAVVEKFSLPNVTVTDIIIYAVSRMLLKHRSINAHFLGECMKLFNHAHVGVAVDTPRGLLVPTLLNADQMSLFDTSANTKSLFEQCKQGTISPDLLKNGTFTITNLGTMGIEMFTPVLNPPQTGILGVCSIVERTRKGQFYPAMGLSLTFDHRALDGADAARFLKDVVDYLELFSVYVLLA